MKLPNSEQAIVPEKKLIGYILSETHAVGKFKARFFRDLGFNETNVVVLRKELLNLAKYNEVKSFEQSNYGTKYIVDGSILTPRKQSVKIRTVWIIEKGKTGPIFVTAYPD